MVEGPPYVDADWPMGERNNNCLTSELHLMLRPRQTSYASCFSAYEKNMAKISLGKQVMHSS